MFKFHINIVLFSIFVLSELIAVHADVVPIPVVLQNNNLKSEINKDTQSVNENSAKAPEENSPRSTLPWDITGNVLKCAISLDGVCLLNEIENLVNKANRNLIREADSQARLITGRKKNDENSPSNLISSITDYVLDVPEILKESISGLIKSGGNFSLLSVEDEDEDDGQGKDEVEEEEEEEEDDSDDDEEEEVEEEEEEADEDEKDEETDDDEKEETENAENAEGEEENTTEVTEAESRLAKGKCTKKKCQTKKHKFSLHGNNSSSRKIGDARGKKKKKKKALFKLFVVLMLIKAKIGMLLKVLAAKLQVKFLIIAFVNLLINLARFWWDLKKGHDHPQKVIYYEHAQHQHHYDGHEDWQSSGPGAGGGGYWGRRSYDENGNEENPKTAQELAYSKHIPYASSSETANENSDSSWNLWG